MRLSQIFEQAAMQEPIIRGYQETMTFLSDNPEKLVYQADMDQYRIHTVDDRNSLFVITKDRTPAALFELLDHSTDTALLKNIYVEPAFRANRLSEKFILYAGCNLKYRYVLLDWRHSKGARAVIQNVAAHVRTEWVNTHTGEVQPFDTPENHYGYKFGSDDRENWTVRFDFDNCKPMPVKEVAIVPLVLPDCTLFYESYFPDDEQ